MKSYIPGGERGERVPAEEQDRDVVVPVQEDQRLLAEHDKQRVNELRHLKVAKTTATVTQDTMSGMYQ